jgi:hypothetical protein
LNTLFGDEKLVFVRRIEVCNTVKSFCYMLSHSLLATNALKTTKLSSSKLSRYCEHLLCDGNSSMFSNLIFEKHHNLNKPKLIDLVRGKFLAVHAVQQETTLKRAKN